MTDRGLTWFRKHRISPFSFIRPVSSEGETNWVSTVTISLRACSPKNFAMFRICGRLPTAENNRLPTAESSFLYSFVFVFGPSHSRSQAERYLWNRVACSDTKKFLFVCDLFLFTCLHNAVMLCWHVHIIHIFHAHSAWLKTSRILRREKSVVAAAWHRCCVYSSRAPLKGKATSPPLWCGGGVVLSPPPPPVVWWGCGMVLGMYGVYGRSGMACLDVWKVWYVWFVW